MRKIAFVLMLVILLGLFAGGQKQTHYTPDLPKEDIQRIEKAYAIKFGYDALWFNPETVRGRLFYIGSDNGYVILIHNVPNATLQLDVKDKTTLSAAGSAHKKKNLDSDIILNWVESDTEYYAFKDGEFLNLIQVYKDGLISKEALEKAAQTYNDAYT